MNCQKCGSPLIPGDKFCKTCGSSVPTMPEQNTMNNGQFNQMPSAMNEPTNNQVMNTPMDLSMNGLQNMNQMSQPEQSQMMPQNGMMNMNNQMPMQNPGQMPNMNQMNNGALGAAPVQKNNNSAFIIVGVIIALAIIGFVVFGNMDFSEGKKVSQGGKEEEKEVPVYTVNVNGFSFKVPQTYIYEISNGYLTFTDESDEWLIRLTVQKMSFETLKTNKEQLKVVAENKGYRAQVPVVKTVDGVELIHFNFEANAMKYNAAYAKLNSMYIATIEGFNKDNTYEDAILERAISVVKTGEYTGDTANMGIAIPDGATELLQLQ